jgi:hypothetical protein
MGELLGKCLMPRVTASFGAPYWSGIGLLKFTAMVGSESDHFVGAINPYKNGDLDSGLCQINLKASEVAKRDPVIRSTSLDEDEWRPAAEANVKAAHDLYIQPWTRNDVAGVREWQPWYGYTKGIAMDPAWWHWSQVTHGWLPTGRYLQRAIPGVVNYHLVIAKDRTRNQALFMAKHFQTTFKVKGELGIDEGIVAWIGVPGRPTEPPPDGVGPKPRPNDGH